MLALAYQGEGLYSPTESLCEATTSMYHISLAIKTFGSHGKHNPAIHW